MAVGNHGRASGFYLNIGNGDDDGDDDDDDDDVIHFSFLSVHLLFPRYVSFGF